MQGRNLRPVTSESPSGGEGVLITGVYGSGKSSVAAEIAYLLEERHRPYALLDLDYLGWGGADFSSHTASYFLMLRNLAAVAGNYREAGVGTFVMAWFVRDHGALRSIREAVGVPLRVVRLTVPLDGIRQRLARRPDRGPGRRPAGGGRADRSLRGCGRRGPGGGQRPPDRRRRRGDHELARLAVTCPGRNMPGPAGVFTADLSVWRKNEHGAVHYVRDRHCIPNEPGNTTTAWHVSARRRTPRA